MKHASCPTSSWNDDGVVQNPGSWRVDPARAPMRGQRGSTCAPQRRVVATGPMTHVLGTYAHRAQQHRHEAYSFCLLLPLLRDSPGHALDAAPTADPQSHADAEDAPVVPGDLECQSLFM